MAWEDFAKREDNRGTALERARDCGWNYREIPGGFEYVSRDRVSAFVTVKEEGTTVSLAYGGHIVLTKKSEGCDLFAVLAKAGRGADELSSTFSQVDDILSTL